MNWKEIEKEFIAWDKVGNFNASQRDILNWFKGKFEQERAKASKEGYENMQYYMEYCRTNGYVTPQDWIEKHKHF